MSRDDRIDVEEREIALTNLDRVLWPSTGTTKRDLIRYYADVAGVIVPHLRGRPLMLGRWPYGVEGRGFGQLECRGRPDWLASFALRLRDGRRLEVCVVNDAPSLVWLANQGVVELHPYLARAQAFDAPSAVVFDLDPGAPAGLRECARLALALRELLSSLGLRAYAKLTGGSGLHVFVPLNAADARYDETKAFAREIAARLVRADPDVVTDRISRAARAGKVFIDWAQNDERKQTIAPYSLRATRRPEISAPLTWDEIDRLAEGETLGALGPNDVLTRVRALGDPFADVATLRQSLPSLARI